MLGPDALSALCRHSWPGNVRELQNVMAALAASAPSARIRARASRPPPCWRPRAPRHRASLCQRSDSALRGFETPHGGRRACQEWWTTDEDGGGVGDVAARLEEAIRSAGLAAQRRIGGSCVARDLWRIIAGHVAIRAAAACDGDPGRPRGVDARVRADSCRAGRSGASDARRVGVGVGRGRAARGGSTSTNHWSRSTCTTCEGSSAVIWGRRFDFGRRYARRSCSESGATLRNLPSRRW